MPKVNVIFFKDEKGRCPVLGWLDVLPKKVEAKARTRIEMLAKGGCELRRPFSDYLRDGIHELRWKYQSVNFRILYFFHERSTVVLSQGFTKEDIVPPKEIEVAIKNRILYESNPKKYGCGEQKDENE